MGKYDPLGDYLRRQRGRDIELSFREIERKIGALLPNAAARTEWWSGTGDAGSREVQKMVWRAAGYEAALLPDDRVSFQSRDDAVATEAAEAAAAAEEGQAPKSKAI